MIEENNLYIPFPGISLKQTRPISTLRLIIPFESNITGCGRKCACRLWPNCHYYNRMRYKEHRGDDEKYWKDIWDYYNNAFKLTVEMPVTNMNG